MALPAIMRRLFAGDGYGPLLKDDIVSKRISIQDWSSSFDYQPATAVRGSDGKPYWSVAASGPNSGGAANPVSDGGTHWVSLPSMADIAAMNYATQSWVGSQGYATQSWVGSQSYATQSWVGSQNYADRPSLFSNGGAGSKLQPGVIPLSPSIAEDSWATVASPSWVKSLNAAIIYIAPNGDDTKDGLSSGAAVRTFAKALEIGSYLSKNGFAIVVAGGTYSDSPNFNSNLYSVPLSVHLDLQGDVTLPGTVNLLNADVFISGERNLIINTTFGNGVSAFNSKIVCYSTVTVNISSVNMTGVFADMGSSLYFQKELTVNGLSSNVNTGLASLQGSNIYLDNGCHIYGTTFYVGLDVRDHAGVYVRGGNININPDTVGSIGIQVSSGSFLYADGTVSVKGGPNRCILVDACSSFRMPGGQLYLYNCPDSCLDASNGSNMHLWVSKITCISHTNGTLNSIKATNASSIFLGSGVIEFSGSVTSMLTSNANSLIARSVQTSFTGSVSGAARRFTVTLNSSLTTYGLGDSICDTVTGNQPGTTANSGFVI